MKKLISILLATTIVFSTVPVFGNTNTKESNEEASNVEAINTEASNVEASNLKAINEADINTETSNLEASNTEASNTENIKVEKVYVEKDILEILEERTYSSGEKEVKFLDFIVDGEKADFKDKKGNKLNIIFWEDEFFIPIEALINNLDIGYKILEKNENNSNSYCEEKIFNLITGKNKKTIEILQNEKLQTIETKNFSGYVKIDDKKDYSTYFLSYNENLYVDLENIEKSFGRIIYTDEIERLAIANKKVYLNEQHIKVQDVEGNELPVFSEGREYLPIRFIANIEGKNISWDEKTKTIILNGIVEPNIEPFIEQEEQEEQEEDFCGNYKSALYTNNLQIEIDNEKFYIDKKNAINYEGNIYFNIEEIEKWGLFSKIEHSFTEWSYTDTSRIDIYQNTDTNYEGKIINILKYIDYDEPEYYRLNIQKEIEKIEKIKNIVPSKNFKHTEIFNEEFKNLENTIINIKKNIDTNDGTYIRDMIIYNLEKEYDEIQERIIYILTNSYKPVEEIQEEVEKMRIKETLEKTLEEILIKQRENMTIDIESVENLILSLEKIKTYNNFENIDIIIEGMKNLKGDLVKHNRYMNNEISLKGSELKKLKQAITKNVKNLMDIY